MELQEKPVVDKMRYYNLVALAGVAMVFALLAHPAFAATNPCPCIAFRLDDVQEYYLDKVQMKIMDEFQKKNASLTVGVIGYDFSYDKKLVSYLKDISKKGHAKVEIANHGWKHENFADLTESQQIGLFNKTNNELAGIFHKRPTVFITPFNLFNNYTLKALQKSKMTLISSGISEDMNKFVTAKGRLVLNRDAQGLYHVPSMTDFQIDVGNETKWTQIPYDKLIGSINFHTSKVGYDVVLLHPQNFAKMENGSYVDVVNSKAIDELGKIIDYARSKNMTIVTLSDIVDMGLPTSQSKPKTSHTTSVHLVTNQTNTTKTTLLTKPANASSLSLPVASQENNSQMGTITISMRYPNGDRVEAPLVSLRVYQDSNAAPYLVVNSISGNPYYLEPLPTGHQYKIQALVEGMLSSTDYVNLESQNQEINMGIADGGSIRATVYYNDAMTPVSNATVIVKSQDNATRGTGFTGPDGQTVRFYLASTNAGSDYYSIQVKIDDHLSYYNPPLQLLSGDADEVKIVTPWPSTVDSLITVRSINQSKILTSSDGDYFVDLFDSKGKEVSESRINLHGYAYFWNLRVGDYVFKTMDRASDTVIGSAAVTIDGLKTTIDIPVSMNKNFKTESVPQNVSVKSRLGPSPHPANE
ncbi:MAG TPA: polysaccharide deacetylase family protein [Candidatus Nitrosotalea sp.]|nr:polysaccharide deacetylase family protein [Candidatus Nitrosotalea sp.]